MKHPKDMIDKINEKTQKRPKTEETNDKELLSKNTESIVMDQINDSAFSSCFECLSKRENGHNKENKYSKKKKNTNTTISNNFEEQKKEARFISSDKTHKQARQIKQSELNKKTYPHDSVCSITDNFNEHISNLNDMETENYINNLATRMKTCSIFPPRERHLFRKNFFVCFMIKLYRKIRLHVNIASIFLATLFILSVVFSSISCYINMTPLGCRLESLDLKIDKEISLQIKIRTFSPTKISLKLSNLSVSVISDNNNNRLLKIIAKEVEIPNNDIPIEFNFKGAFNRKKAVIDIIREMKATGFKICCKVKVQFDGILGLKSKIDIKKTINFTKNKGDAENSGVLFHLLKGEKIDFSKTYKDENLTNFFFFSTNTVDKDGSEGEIIPLYFPNLKRISVAVKDLEICYFGDNLVTEKVLFEYLRIENGKLLPFKSDNDKVSPIDLQLKLVDAFVSNRHLTLQNVNICGTSFLSESVVIKETNDIDGSSAACDYKIVVNQLSLDVIDITIHPIDKSLGGLDSFLKTVCVTLDEIQEPNILFKLTTLDETPRPIGTLKFSCVFDEKRSINLHLTDIDLHLFIKAVKNGEIVKIFMDEGSKYEGFMCFKTLLPPSKSLETIHTRRKKRDEQEQSSYFLKSTLSPISLDTYSIKNWLNLTAPPASSIFKSAFQIEILDTELQISNDFCSVSLLCEKQTLKKTEKTPNFEQGFAFSLNIKLKKFPENFDLQKYFTFPLDRNKEICFITLSRGVLGLKECISLSNSAYIQTLANSVVSMQIKSTEKISGGFNCDINLPARYILADKESQSEVNKRSSINLSFVNNRILFNRLFFSFKNCDLISMIINRKIKVLDLGSTNYPIHLPSLIINSQLSKNVFKQTSESVSVTAQIKEPDSLQSLKAYINEINNLVHLDLNHKSVHNNRPTFEFKLEASKDCKNFKFFLSFYDLPDIELVIENFKEAFFSFNSHSHYSESRSDSNIDNEIKQMAENIINLLNFPFNHVEFDFNEIEFNLKENGEVINILKIKKPSFLFCRNPSEFKIEGEFSLMGLLKILANDNLHLEIILYSIKGEKIFFYKSEEKLGLLTFIKQYLQKPVDLDEKFNANETFFVFSSNRKDEGVFLKKDILTANLDKICFLPRRIPFIKLFNLEYRVVLDLPYENLVSFSVPAGNAERPIEIEVLRNNFSTLACAILIQYLFYTEEATSLWPPDITKAIEVLLNGYKAAKSLIYYPLERAYNAIKTCISYIPYNLSILTENTFTGVLSNLYKKARDLDMEKWIKEMIVIKIQDKLMKNNEEAQINGCLSVRSYLKSRIELSHKPFPFCTTLSLHLDKSNSESLDEREIWRFVSNGSCLKQVLVYNQQTRNVIRLDLIISSKSNNTASNNIEKSQEAEFFRYIIRYYELFQEYLEGNYMQELEFRSFLGYVEGL
ncbi:hypothetical protein CDIK_0209 [Cucumispora dikerogammari]|nr:hypothetical protein CDIK_0209 [Cucumispora dikerogammari]